MHISRVLCTTEQADAGSEGADAEEDASGPRNHLSPAAPLPPHHAITSSPRDAVRYIASQASTAPAGPERTGRGAAGDRSPLSVALMITRRAAASVAALLPSLLTHGDFARQ